MDNNMKCKLDKDLIEIGDVFFWGNDKGVIINKTDDSVYVYFFDDGSKVLFHWSVLEAYDYNMAETRVKVTSHEFGDIGTEKQREISAAKETLKHYKQVKKEAKEMIKAMEDRIRELKQ